MSTIETPVLIVGGGPSGLAASITLSRLGVDSVLAEKHPSTLYHPKAIGVMQRTAELLRLWSAEDEMRAKGVPRELCDQMVWATTLAGEELGRTSTVEPDNERDEPQSPTTGLRCPQHITEAILRDRAGAYDTARLGYGLEVTSFEQDEGGVTAQVVERESGEESTVHAQYLLAADGNGSGTRAACGIGRSGDADMGHFLNIFHRVDLSSLVRDRPAWSYSIMTPDLFGAFVAIDGDQTWIFHLNLARGETPEDYSDERCAAIIRKASGLPDAEVEIISVKSWIMGAEMSGRFRDRRVLLIGDAAHRTTPDGGVGMNTGVQSAHNAAWKVGAVASGWAGEDLLDTYEVERRAVAQTNVDYSAGRGGALLKVVEAIRADDLDAVRAGIAARPSGGRQGQDLGYTYDSAAVVADGTNPPPVEDRMREYVQNARPGGRAPHLWVSRNGDRLSTLDLFGSGLLLLTARDGAAWGAAAAELPASVPIRVMSVGEAGDLRAPDGRLEKAYGVESDGAVLVRPDGFVGWRAQRAGSDPGRELRGAVAAVTARAA